MLVKTEARILIFPGTDFHFPSTSVPPGTFLRLWCELGINCGISGTFCSTDTAYSNVHFLRPNVFRRRKLDLRTARNDIAQPGVRHCVLAAERNERLIENDTNTDDTRCLLVTVAEKSISGRGKSFTRKMLVRVKPAIER